MLPLTSRGSTIGHNASFASEMVLYVYFFFVGPKKPF